MAFAFNAPFHALKPYTPAIDIWSIGCIFAEILTGKPLFPGKNAVHQLDLITDLLGTPSVEAIARIKNEKARRYLSSMRKKSPIPLSQRIPRTDPLALKLLERLIAFDPRDRPSAEEALSDPYFQGLANVEDEPSTNPISKFEFDFERRKLSKDDARELIYREILEYHPQMLREYLGGMDHTHFMYPSGIEQFKQKFHQLEDYIGKGVRNAPIIRRYASLPRERVCVPIDEDDDENVPSVSRACLPSPPREKNEPESANNSMVDVPSCRCRPCYSARCMLRSSSISASQCIEVKGGGCEDAISKQKRNGMNGFSENVAVLYA